MSYAPIFKIERLSFSYRHASYSVTFSLLTHISHISHVTADVSNQLLSHSSNMHQLTFSFLIILKSVITSSKFVYFDQDEGSGIFTGSIAGKYFNIVFFV